jgi:hypothetical protein
MTSNISVGLLGCKALCTSVHASYFTFRRNILPPFISNIESLDLIGKKQRNTGDNYI